MRSSHIQDFKAQEDFQLPELQLPNQKYDSYLIPLHRETSAVKLVVIVVDGVGKTISGEKMMIIITVDHQHHGHELSSSASSSS